MTRREKWKKKLKYGNGDSIRKNKYLTSMVNLIFRLLIVIIAYFVSWVTKNAMPSC